MALDTSSAVLGLAVAQVAVPLLKSLLQRRQERHETAAEQVPLLAQTLRQVADDVRDIRSELRIIGEHSTALEVLRAQVAKLEKDINYAHLRLRELERGGAAGAIRAAANVVKPEGGG